jgi:hypothetical protein
MYGLKPVPFRNRSFPQPVAAGMAPLTEAGAATVILKPPEWRNLS